jgi:TRAP-type mannitol/chloroaromatic compound transport system permease small subunit
MVGDISGVVGKTNEWLVVAMVEQVVKVVVKKEEKEKPR